MADGPDAPVPPCANLTPFTIMKAAQQVTPFLSFRALDSKSPEVNSWSTGDKHDPEFPAKALTTKQRE